MTKGLGRVHADTEQEAMQARCNEIQARYKGDANEIYRNVNEMRTKFKSARCRRYLSEL